MMAHASTAMPEPLPLPLPVPRTCLIGRFDERAIARARVLDHPVPLLTLLGPGGVGKTHLALTIAREVAAQFADGVVWVDLAPLAGPAQVAAAVAAALALPPAAAPARPELEHLIHALRPRQTLLLLDNCEHVLAGVADLIGRVLMHCPALQILATSRAPLRLRGEHLQRINPLPLPARAPTPWPAVAANEAVRLFVERARAVDAGFRLDATNAATVVAICHQLDGLPLAIELAAASIATLSPGAILSQMTHRFQLLRRGPRDLPPRQQTMLATIAWSFDLLTPAARALYRRLAVFAGGFTLAAAQAVAAPVPPAATLAALTALLEQSLLQRSPFPPPPPLPSPAPAREAREPRFTMLETIREHARAQLDVEAGAAARAAHAAYFRSLAAAALPALVRTGDPAWLDRLEADHDNLLVALDWLAAHDGAGLIQMAGALGWYWYYRGHFQAGRPWLERAVALAATDPMTPPAAHADALIGLGLLLGPLGDGERAARLLATGAALRRAHGDAIGSAYAESLRGGALVSLGRYEEAGALFTALLPWWRRQPLTMMAGHALFHLGLVAYTRGDHPRARARCLEAVAVFEATDCELDTIEPLHYLGLNACATGDAGDAAGFFSTALARLRRRASRADFAHGLADVATLAVVRGDLVPAARLFGAANALRRETGTPFPLPARAAYEAAAARARVQLGPAAWAIACTDGESWSLADALAEAAAMLGAGRQPPGRLPALGPDGADPNPGAVSRRPPVPLSRREREVLGLLAQRYTDPEIARQLSISPRTASHHVGSIFSKLGATDRRQAVALAARSGLL